MSLSIKSAAYSYCPRPLRLTWDRVEASDLGSRLARGAFWSLAGAAISRGMMLAASILAARMLGREAFGELGVIRSTVGMFGILAGFGLGLTATKHVAEFRRTDPERAGRIIALSALVAFGSGGVMALVLLAFAPWLAAHTLAAPHLSGLLRIGCLLLLLGALNGAQTGALAGFEAFRSIARVNSFAGLASFPIVVAGVWLGGLPGAVWGLILSLAVNWTLNHVALRREAARAGVPLRFAGCTQEWSVLLQFSLPAALAGIMVGPVNWACGAMLVNRPGGYAEMGIFSAANQWGMAILFIPAAVGRMALPVLANLHGEQDTVKYNRALRYNALLNAGVALAVAIPVSLFSSLIMASHGEGFAAGATTLALLSFSAVLMAVNVVIGQAIASKGKMWIGLLFNSLWAVAALATSAILLSRGHGAAGLAAAQLTAYLFHTCWQGYYLLRTN